MDPDPARYYWANNIGIHMIESVTISVGGDAEKKWYCKQCRQSHGSDSHPKICGLTHYKYNESKAFQLTAAAYKNWFDGEKELNTIEEFRDLDQDFLATLMNEEGLDSDEDFYDEYTCMSEEFEFAAREGTVIDSMDSDYLKLWSDLQDSGRSEPH
jgi:hypothetical protein